MQNLPGSAGDLARLKREREEADRAYNDALTALDGAIQRLRDLPLPPPSYDESQLPRLNEQWELLSLKAADRRGWLARVRAHVWAMVAPLFERQQAFNAALVDHANRNAAIHRETTRAMASTLSAVREEFEGLVRFQSKLIQYAQQITPFVDTKDRYVVGLLNGFAAAFGHLSDDMLKRWESAEARERRHEAQLTEVRGTQSVVQRAVQTLTRELERRRPAEGEAIGAPASPTASSSVDSYKYVAFEDQFRGSPWEIRQRLSAYLPDFQGARDVLDIGCGRGEFLDLLREQGIPARGIDINPEMAAICRERGLDATAGDALTSLLSQSDASLGGVFAAQVVEHLEPDYLMRLLSTAYHKLRPGSKIVLETVNVACWSAFFSSYIRDLSHLRPIHPDTLKYLLVANGFQRVEIRYSSPFPEESKLQPIPTPRHASGATGGAGDERWTDMASIFNENAKKLNDLLFTHLDFAVIGERL